MIVLITGASGFIGRPLAVRLLAAGHTLHILTRNLADTGNTGFKKFLDSMKIDLDGSGAGQVRFFTWPELGDVPDKAFEGVEAVFHLAGENIGAWPWTRARKRRIRDSRVLGSRLLVEAMGRQVKPPRIFVAASAMGYYGEAGSNLCNEDQAPGTGFLAEVVSAWETEIFKASSLGIRTVAVRSGLVLGTRSDGSGLAGALGKMLPAFQWGLGTILGTGRQYWSWIHLVDAVDIYMHAMLHVGLVGPVNACAPQPVTQAEFSQSLARLLHRPRWLSIPAFLLRLGLGGMAETLLQGQRGDTKKLFDSGYRFQFASLDMALQDLLKRIGLTPR